MNYTATIPKKRITALVKCTVLVLASYSIYSKINGNSFPLFSFEQNAVALLIALSVFNWHFEILKWKLLVNSFKKTRYKAACTQSLAAHTVAITTPNKIGEYGAKALFYKRSLRKKILGLAFLGNAHQLLMTVLFGVFGLYFYTQRSAIPFQTTLVFGFYCVLAGGILSYIYTTSKFKKIAVFIKVIPVKTQALVSLYSLVRYLLFSFQYYYFLQLFGVEIPYKDLFPLIWLMYFISSCIPSFSLADFAIKGSVALFLFSGLGIPESTIVATAFFMWVLNFAIPAAIGGVFVARFSTENQLDYDRH